MYASFNFKSKKDLRDAVSDGVRVTVVSPGVGTPVYNGTEFIEGPYGVHKWYAEVEVKDGRITKVK
jgi:hypothetical protein